METKIKNTPQIYVACLASYNSGILHGKWIDASQGEQEVHEEIKKILQTSTHSDAEEYAIHDYEGFYGITIQEYDPVSKVCEIAETLEELEKDEKAELFGDLFDDYGMEVSKEMLENQYLGCYDSSYDFVYQYVEDSCILEKVSENIKRYFDYDSLFRDMTLNGEIIEIISKDHKRHYFYTT